VKIVFYHLKLGSRDVLMEEIFNNLDLILKLILLEEEFIQDPPLFHYRTRVMNQTVSFGINCWKMNPTNAKTMKKETLKRSTRNICKQDFSHLFNGLLNDLQTARF